MPKIGKYGKISLTKEDLKYLRQNYYKKTNAQIAVHLGIKITSLRKLANANGFKKVELELWTEEQVEFLLENYASIGDQEMSEIFTSKWHKNKGWFAHQIEKKRSQLSLKRTRKEFLAVHKRNKESGRLAVANQRRWETLKAAPIGTIKLYDYNGHKYPYIKQEGGYTNYCRWLWEQTHGAIPEDCVIALKVSAASIPTIQDLECISRGELAQRNQASFYNLPPELRELVSLKNKITKKIKAL